MKGKILAVFFAAVLFLCSCSVVMPGSDEAKLKLENAGYEVERVLVTGVDAQEQGIQQMVQLNVYEEDTLVLQIYYFSNEEDADHFYDEHRDSLMRGQEVFKKNKYSIYRGTVRARDALLKED